MLRSNAMPIIRAAEKRVRADRKRRARNLRIHSELKTLVQKLRKQIQTGPADQARDAFRFFVKRLDQAAVKKIIPKNTASRTKSRLARALAKSRS